MNEEPSTVAGGSMDAPSEQKTINVKRPKKKKFENISFNSVVNQIHDNDGTGNEIDALKSIRKRLIRALLQ